MDDEGFIIKSWKVVEPRRDGTLRRNSYTVQVEIDGTVHDVAIRRSSSAPHLPQDLLNHPLGPEVKKAAMAYVLARLRERIDAIRALDN